MQSKRLPVAASRSSMNWLLIERLTQASFKKFSFLLLSLAMASTTNAQVTSTHANVAESGETVDHTQVVIRVPNVTCYGRFHDALKEHLQDKHDWIHMVKISDTGETRNLVSAGGYMSKSTSAGKTGGFFFDIGTVAELTFTIDSSRTTLDLLKTIKETQRYSMKDWTVQLEVSVEKMLLQ